MSTNPDQIRREIEQTRYELSTDVDALAYKASPRRMVNERTEKVRGAFRRAKDTVMGTASGASDHAGSVVSDAASTVADNATDVSAKVKRAAEGNPIAAGVLVFAGAWLVSSLLPSSRGERQAAEQLKSSAQEHAGPVAEAAGDALHEMQNNLRGPVQEAAEQVKSTATEATQTVKEEAKSAARSVGEDASRAQDELTSR